VSTYSRSPLGDAAAARSSAPNAIGAAAASVRACTASSSSPPAKYTRSDAASPTGRAPPGTRTESVAPAAGGRSTHSTPVPPRDPAASTVPSRCGRSACGAGVSRTRHGAPAVVSRVTAPPVSTP
jgi:hypothetical protein